MNMKKIAAAVVASVMAVSTMAIAASAEALATKTGNDESSVNYEISFEGLTEEQVKSIVKVEADFSVTSNMVNGTIGFNKAGTWDGNTGKYEINQDTAPAKGTAVLEVAEGDFVSKDNDGNLAPHAEIQIWWVNPQYDDEGNEGDPGVAEITYVGLFDKDGNAVKEFGSRGNAVTPAPTESESSEPVSDTTTGAAGDTNKPTDDKNNAETGIEGVAIVAGLAVLAGGAVIVAKKRK